MPAATPSNPTNLPARYEIRKLTEEHIPWVMSIVLHSNIFYSPVWPICYPDEKAARLYRGYKAADYLVRHQVESGHSFGVFDLEYQYKREQSRATGGKLYWDLQDTNLGAEELFEQMDFPLVSVALAYDGINALEMDKMGPLMECLPLFGTFYHILGELDQRNDSWKPKGPKQVLMRNATSTRHDAEGKGIMKNLAQFLMRYAAEEGFRGIQIEAFSDAVTKVWLHPPPSFTGNLISEFMTEDYEEDRQVNGSTTKVKLFGDVKQRATKIFVDLKPNANGHVSGEV